MTAAWFGRAASAVNSNLKIYCGDSHLNFLAAGKFRDPQNGNAQVSVGSSNTACGGTLRAFAYSATPSNVIVLCSDSDNGALRPSTRVTINTWNIGGDFRLNTRGIDTFGNYLSYKILHELFHCASFQQCMSIPYSSPMAGRHTY